jgi:hypothetical protein
MAQESIDASFSSPKSAMISSLDVFNTVCIITKTNQPTNKQTNKQTNKNQRVRVVLLETWSVSAMVHSPLAQAKVVPGVLVVVLQSLAEPSLPCSR